MCFVVKLIIINSQAMDTEVKLTASQIRKMQHALGMDNKKPKRGKYEAYRNYYNTSSEDSELEDLIKVGYATKRARNSQEVERI